MSGRRAAPPAPRGNIARGVFLLARGKAEGLGQFAPTRQAFLASLAPMLAFPLVGFLLVLLASATPSTPAGAGAIGPLEGFTDLIGTLCAVLAPPVLSFELARRWQREALWLRYATALDWVQWVIPVLISVLLIGVYPLLAATLSARVALGLVGLAIVGYALWLHWFVARHGLMLSPGRAALLVFLVNLGTALLAFGPRLLALGSGHSG